MGIQPEVRPAEIRDQLRFVMQGYAAAQATQHPLVMQGMTLIADNELQRLIPDKPTLAEVEAANQRGLARPHCPQSV